MIAQNKSYCTIMSVFQGAEQEPGPQGRGLDFPRLTCTTLLKDAEKRPHPPDGWGLLGPQQHGSPVRKFVCITYCADKMPFYISIKCDDQCD